MCSAYTTNLAPAVLVYTFITFTFSYESLYLLFLSKQQTFKSRHYASLTVFYLLQSGGQVPTLELRKKCGPWGQIGLDSDSGSASF